MAVSDSRAIDLDMKLKNELAFELAFWSNAKDNYENRRKIAERGTPPQ
jgi:hypothetical protein